MAPVDKGSGAGIGCRDAVRPVLIARVDVSCNISGIRLLASEYEFAFQLKNWITFMRISIHRIYADNDSETGHRVLVDRMWPRGISKDEVDLDAWFKDFAPSDDLRKWFGHAPEKWREFRKKYRQELRQKKEDVKAKFSDFDLRKPLILLYTAHDQQHNNAVVLKEFLEEVLPSTG